jgi:hypothetical protein
MGSPVSPFVRLRSPVTTDYTGAGSDKSPYGRDAVQLLIEQVWTRRGANQRHPKDNLFAAQDGYMGEYVDVM